MRVAWLIMFLLVPPCSAVQSLSASLLELAFPAESGLAHARSHSRRKRLPLTAKQQEELCFLKQKIPIILQHVNSTPFPTFSTCAVVSSSNALLRHTYGSEIDKHDAVLRFDETSTDGIEVSAGHKETIRVFKRKRHKDPQRNDIYISIFDQANGKPTQRVFMLQGLPLKIMSHALRRLQYPRSDIVSEVVDDAESEAFGTRSIGMLLALTFCDSTDAYEITPSMADMSALENNYGLSIKDSHPARTSMQEAAIWASLSTTSDQLLEATGKASFEGFSSLPCGKDLHELEDRSSEIPTAATPHSRFGPSAQQPKTRHISLLQIREAFSASLMVARVLAACIPLGAVYLIWLWRERGLLGHLQAGLQRTDSSTAKGAIALITYLCLLVCIDLSIKYQAEYDGGSYKTSPFIMVPVVEFGKLAVSVVMILTISQKPEGDAPSSPPSSSDSSEWWNGLFRIMLRMLPVALLYNMNNILIFYVLVQVNMDAYAVWRNTSIVFNALLWVIVFNRTLGMTKWLAICLLFMACCLNTIGVDGRWDIGLPVLGVVISAFLSSVAGVCNESVIKAVSTTQLTIDQVNCTLYLETLLLMAAWFVLAAIIGVQLPDFWQGIATITPGAGRIILMQIALGLAVSRVLKYADVVAKTVAGSFREVIIIIVAPYVVSGTRYNWVTVSSACWVGIAGLLYFSPSAPPAPKATEKDDKDPEVPVKDKSTDETDPQKDAGQSIGKDPEAPVIEQEEGEEGKRLEAPESNKE